jgi:hypothetical protein
MKITFRTEAARAEWEDAGRTVETRCLQWIKAVKADGRFAGYHREGNGFFPSQGDDRLYFSPRHPLGWYSGGIFKPLEVGDLIAVTGTGYDDTGIIRVTSVKDRYSGTWEWVEKTYRYQSPIQQDWPMVVFVAVFIATVLTIAWLINDL